MRRGRGEGGSELSRADEWRSGRRGGRRGEARKGYLRVIRLGSASSRFVFCIVVYRNSLL
eukprot:754426-Hanusia_phi.AAC.6